MKQRIDRPVIVEGKYDKIKIASCFDALVITTDGFGIFRNKEKRELIKAVSAERGVIVCTDSDGAGGVIRSHLNGLVSPDKIVNVYIPRIKGKEKRKIRPSAEGYLGVEGVDCETLHKVFAPFIDGAEITGEKITAADLYELGLCGRENSEKRRHALCERLGLPPLSSKAFSDAVGYLYTKDKIAEESGKITEEDI